MPNPATVAADTAALVGPTGPVPNERQTRALFRSQPGQPWETISQPGVSAHRCKTMQNNGAAAPQNLTKPYISSPRTLPFPTAFGVDFRIVASVFYGRWGIGSLTPSRKRG
jgi:hypothetical protein